MTLPNIEGTWEKQGLNKDQMLWASQYSVFGIQSSVISVEESVREL